MNATADWRTEQREAAKQLRMLLVEADLMQTTVSEQLGMSRSAMSDFLNARRQWPDDFEERFRAAVTLVRGAK